MHILFHSDSVNFLFELTILLLIDANSELSLLLNAANLLFFVTLKKKENLIQCYKINIHSYKNKHSEKLKFFVDTEVTGLSPRRSREAPTTKETPKKNQKSRFSTKIFFSADKVIGFRRLSFLSRQVDYQYLNDSFFFKNLFLIIITSTSRSHNEIFIIFC